MKQKITCGSGRGYDAFRKSPFLLIIFYLLLLFGCGVHRGVTPLPPQAYPLFIDNQPKENLLTAIDHQLHYLQGIPGEKKLTIGTINVTYQELTASLKTFRKIIAAEPAPLVLNRLIHEHFQVFQADGRKDQPAGEILLTGYYEPVFDGSLDPDPAYTYPLYRPPDSLTISIDSQSGTKNYYRTTDSGPVPFWSRREIEEDRRLLAGNELVYLRDPLDAYLLHVQGSGRIRLPDGSIKAIHFAASNGKAYNSLGKLFVDKKILPLEQVSIPTIRSYFKQHPETLKTMLYHNPRYIFFRWGDNQGPRGSLGEILTPGRSLAIDPTVLPGGLIAYLESRRPMLRSNGTFMHWQPLHRFVVPQDTGSAITGAGRADLFWGNGHYAEIAASTMKEKGKLYFLLQKHFACDSKIR